VEFFDPLADILLLLSTSPRAMTLDDSYAEVVDYRLHSVAGHIDRSVEASRAWLI
jgi:hypothetical protein